MQSEMKSFKYEIISREFDGSHGYTWSYETDVPLQVGEIIHTCGYGLYQVQYIWRYVKAGVEDDLKTDEVNCGTLRDSLSSDEIQYSYGAFAREVNMLKVQKGEGDISTRGK